MCQTIIIPFSYLNAEERFWTDLRCQMKERGHYKRIILYVDFVFSNQT